MVNLMIIPFKVEEKRNTTEVLFRINLNCDMGS